MSNEKEKRENEETFNLNAISLVVWKVYFNLIVFNLCWRNIFC